MGTSNSTIIVALIAAFPPTLVSVLSLISSRKNSEKIQDIHLSINSRMDELLKASKAESRAEGREAGRNETPLS